MTLRIYGDSFGENDTEQSWSSKVSQKLKRQMINKALGGTSTEYSFRLFVEDIKAGVFETGDIIIFVTSTPGRLFFKHHITAPREAGMVFTAPKSYDWYWNNIKHIRWYLENIDWTVLKLSHEAYISAIKDAAYQYPDCLFVILSNSESGEDFDIKIDPPNFLRSRTYLLEISRREVLSGTLEKFYTEYVDPRINHLCLPNLEILSDLVIESIRKRDVSCITYDKFQTNLIDPITTRKEYINYVNSGMIPWRDWWYEQLKK